MANTAISGTVTAFDIRGGREDLSDVIYNISPTDTPFMSNIQKGQATQTFAEWQTDVLATASTSNAQVQGADITTFDTFASTTRVGNYTQISSKSIIIAGTTDAVDKAGRKSELAYQIAKRAAELKRDMEAILLNNQAALAGADGTAATLAGLPAWLFTNVDKDAGGTNPSYTHIPAVTRGDGTQRAFTETILKNVVQLMYTNGGKPEMLMVGPTEKQTTSGFSGVATKTFYQSAVEQTAIIGGVDVYVSDFGTFSVVPNRFQRSRDGWFIDPEMAGVLFLRPFQTEPLAKTGDAEKRLILAEYTLKVNNEKGLGLAADLS